MKISTTFHKKVPVPGIEYGSQGVGCEITVEPPLEIREDREKLRRYVQALFRECRERVEHELAQQEEPANSERPVRRASTSSRQFTAPRSTVRNSNQRAIW